MHGERLGVTGFQAGTQELDLLPFARCGHPGVTFVHDHVDDLVADVLQHVVFDVGLEQLEPGVFYGAAWVGVDWFHTQLQRG